MLINNQAIPDHACLWLGRNEEDEYEIIVPNEHLDEIDLNLNVQNSVSYQDKDLKLIGISFMETYYSKLLCKKALTLSNIKFQ